MIKVIFKIEKCLYLYMTKKPKRSSKEVFKTTLSFEEIAKAVMQLVQKPKASEKNKAL